MLEMKSLLFMGFSCFLLLGSMLPADASIRRYTFTLRKTEYTRLCETKSLMTVNGEFPGPTLYANQGDTIVVDVINMADENATIHWHGVNQPRYPWSDGPEYITQCPIKPGSRFRQRVLLSEEIGTLWWHAHSEWTRLTVHGALIIYPKKKNDYPFARPYAEVPIILGEWWKTETKVMNELIRGKRYPNVSDAFLINGQPGDLYPCSTPDTYTLTVDPGKTYLLRMVNAVMNNVMFFKIAAHNLTVVGSDASYTKPYTTDSIAISPGQTIDFLLESNQSPSHYYMASRVYDVVPFAYDNTTTTAVLKYSGNYTAPSTPLLPTLPAFDDTAAATAFQGSLRSLASKEHPVNVPLNVTENLLYTVSMNLVPCPVDSCPNGPFGEQVSTSINNITFVAPEIDLLQAYYRGISGTYGDDFPEKPPLEYNYTADNVPRLLWTPRNGTEVKVLEYNSTVELVLQGTNIVLGIEHPMHLHGYSLYVVGWGFGNFDKDKDPLRYNLVDPPLLNTVSVPRNGWTALRFKATNPGVWLMHCHFEIHVSWGMATVFIVKNGKTEESKMLPPPRDMPKC